MKIVINTNKISPHTVPLALKLCERFGNSDVRYLHFYQGVDKYRANELFESIRGIACWTQRDLAESDRICSDADILVEDVRNLRRMLTRVLRGKFTAYMSERWFKPIRLDAPLNTENAAGRGVLISGFWRLCSPFALWRALQMVRLLKLRNNKFLYLAEGIKAAQDMARMCGLLNGDLRCLFRPPSLGFESRPGGRIWSEDGRDSVYCLGRMRLWGYFVANTITDKPKTPLDEKFIKVLWMGRILGCKRVDTLVKAVKGVGNLDLDIYGVGPDEKRIKRLAAGLSNVHFHGMVSQTEVRRQMRLHDVYVFSSNEVEGWGAVVNEALEEGMKVLGSYEAGASATLLPETNLFHSGDWRTLRRLLMRPVPPCGIGDWTVSRAADVIVDLAKECGVPCE